MRSGLERGRTVAWLLLAVFYTAAGIEHLRAPNLFIRVTPAWVPEPAFVVMTTGVCELAGAVALFIPRLRWWAGVMLALYALCVWPANVQHALTNDPPIAIGWWYHGPRLILQPVIIWWALFAGAVTSWPFRRARA